MSSKEFKTVILDSKPQAMREKVFPLSYPVQTLNELNSHISTSFVQNHDTYGRRTSTT